MDKIKLTKAQVDKLKDVEAQYKQRLDSLQLECQQKIQKVLDDYNLSKARNI